jgi:SAM-dependent methyltransferase
MSDGVRDSKSRFSDRVHEYVKYRPHYSPDVVGALQQACGLRRAHQIADVGCGTGLLAEIFLANGNRVLGVEPNREMREAGEAYLERYRGFVMVDGSAEATNLDSSSIDFVVAGQAFHWFRPEDTKVEFGRILKPNGSVALIWHDRDCESTAFLRAYEEFLLHYSVDYEQVQHKYLASYEALERFFSPNPMQVITQRAQQKLDFDGLRGRLLSSSYVPKSGEVYDAMLEALPQLFSGHAEDGHVILEYDTRIYYGHVSP